MDVTLQLLSKREEPGETPFAWRFQISAKGPVSPKSSFNLNEVGTRCLHSWIDEAGTRHSCSAQAVNNKYGRGRANGFLCFEHQNLLEVRVTNTSRGLISNEIDATNLVPRLRREVEAAKLSLNTVIIPYRTHIRALCNLCGEIHSGRIICG